MSFKEKILETAENMFTRFGLRSVTMDDIARDLSISKKTLYGCIRDKKELVLLSITKNVLDHKKESEEIFSNIKHPIDQMSAIFDSMYKRVSQINPSVFMDLKKSYPKAFEQFNSFREEFIYNKIRENLLAGIEMGVYRDDIDVNLIAKFYITSVEFILTPKKEEEMNIIHSQYELINYHLRGIATDKGLKYLKEKPINNGTKI